MLAKQTLPASDVSFKMNLVYSMRKFVALPAMAAVAVGLSFASPAQASNSAQVKSAVANLSKVCAEAAAAIGPARVMAYCAGSAIAGCTIQNSSTPMAVVSCLNHLAATVEHVEDEVANAAKNAAKKAGKEIKHLFHSHHHHHHHHH